MAPWIDVQRRVCASRRDCTKSASAHHSGAGDGAGFVSTVVVLSAAQKPSWRARPLAMRPCWNDLVAKSRFESASTDSRTAASCDSGNREGEGKRKRKPYHTTVPWYAARFSTSMFVVFES